MSSMRAIDIHGGKGPISALYINNDTPKPVPKHGHALVKIKAFGLNRMDLLQREGKYRLPPQAPSTLGVEFSGTIESLVVDETIATASTSSISTSNETFDIGDEVFGLAYGGAYAEYITVAMSTLIHKPSEISWEEAAGIPETWITALQAMHVVGEFKPGQSILWHAGGSVSLCGIQLARAVGARAIFVTTSSQEKIDFCKSVGATMGFNHRQGNWADEVLKYTNGKGVDLIIDVIGAAYFNQNLDAAAEEGHIVSLGTLGGPVVHQPVDISRFLRKRVRYEGSTLRARSLEYQAQLRNRLVELALPKFANGSFKAYIDKVFDWNDIQQAHELLASGKVSGKIICLVS